MATAGLPCVWVSYFLVLLVLMCTYLEISGDLHRDVGRNAQSAVTVVIQQVEAIAAVGAMVTSTLVLVLGSPVHRAFVLPSTFILIVIATFPRDLLLSFF